MPFSAPTIRFTTAGLSALPATGKTHDLSDAAVAGPILRVGPTGRKRWLFRFKSKGRPSRIKVGPFPKIGIAKARERALAHRLDLGDGIDPRRSARPALQAAKSAEAHRRPEVKVAAVVTATDSDRNRPSAMLSRFRGRRTTTNTVFTSWCTSSSSSS